MTERRGISAAEKYAELEAAGLERPRCECHGEPMRWNRNSRGKTGYWYCGVKVNNRGKAKRLSRGLKRKPNCIRLGVDLNGRPFCTHGPMSKSGSSWLCSEGNRTRCSAGYHRRRQRDPEWWEEKLAADRSRRRSDPEFIKRQYRKEVAKQCREYRRRLKKEMRLAQRAHKGFLRRLGLQKSPYADPTIPHPGMTFEAGRWADPEVHQRRRRAAAEWQRRRYSSSPLVRLKKAQNHTIYNARKSLERSIERADLQY